MIDTNKMGEFKYSPPSQKKEEKKEKIVSGTMLVYL